MRRSSSAARATWRGRSTASRPLPSVGTPFLLVVGASGAGKSSLVRAGLAPRLTAPGVAADVDVWRVALMRPGPRPIEALAEALFARGDAAATDGQAPTRLCPSSPTATTRRRPRWPRFCAEARQRCASDPGCARSHRPRGAEARRSRAAVACRLVARRRSARRAVRCRRISRRSRWICQGCCARSSRASGYGWWPRCARRSTSCSSGKDDLEALKDAGADYDLAPPGPAELAEIVRKPAEAAGLVYETNAAGERLDERLLRDAAGVDTLPPLQFTLQRLFAERQIVGPERRLAFAAYGALGGVGGAIDLAAERALAGLGEAEVGALPRLLRQLAIPVHEASPNDAGRPLLAIRAATLLEAATDAAACRLVDALVEARILVHAKERGVPTIGLAHERVLESWQRARAIVGGQLASRPRRNRRPRRGLSYHKTAVALHRGSRGARGRGGDRLLAVFRGPRREADSRAAEMAALAERDRAARQRQLAEDERKQSEEQRDIAQKRQEQAEEQRAARARPAAGSRGAARYCAQARGGGRSAPIACRGSAEGS